MSTTATRSPSLLIADSMPHSKYSSSGQRSRCSTRVARSADET